SHPPTPPLKGLPIISLSSTQLNSALLSSFLPVNRQPSPPLSVYFSIQGVYLIFFFSSLWFVAPLLLKVWPLLLDRFLP
ncbi:uncharacterized protein BO95DRAFT_393991, partial [Aspergillus brunneoviolaceus CBS 621.78]